MKPLDTKNNPKNNEHVLYKKLTKYFSGPIATYNTRSPQAQKRKDLDKYSTIFKDVTGRSFQKISNSKIFRHINGEYLGALERGHRYADFEQMEYDPILASCLDVYGDEITCHNQYNKILKISSPKEEIKTILETLFYDVLSIDFNLFSWVRNACKYGDEFICLDADEEIGIKQAIRIPPIEIERLEGRDETNANYVQFRWNSGNIVFERWQIAHFRFLGNDKYAPYGTSVLDPARRAWRQSQLMEDSMMAYRVVRATERRKFKIDIRAVPPEDREQYVLRQKEALKQNQVIDSTTGRVDLRYNALSAEDDYVIPVLGPEDATDIETLEGGQGSITIDDIKYIQDRLFAAIKIPKTYLIRGEGGDEEKGTLAQKDVRFAHTIVRLQQAIVSELSELARVHLYILGYRGEDLRSFELALNNPSKISELQELESWKQKFEAASSVPEYVPERWISEKILGVSNEEFARWRIEKMHDVEYHKGLEGEEESDGAGGGSGGFDDLFGGAGDDGDDLDLNEPGPAEGGEASIEPDDSTDDSMLLATPPGQARRADGRPVHRKATDNSLQKQAKGHAYQPVKVSRNPSEARSRHIRSQSMPEFGTHRSIFETNRFPILSRKKKLLENEQSSYSSNEKYIEEASVFVEKLEKMVNSDES